MGNLDKAEQDWEHIYSQFKIPTGDTVVCFVHKQTKNHIYLDVKLKRFLSKQEALIYRADVTGKYLIHP